MKTRKRSCAVAIGAGILTFAACQSQGSAPDGPLNAALASGDAAGVTVAPLDATGEHEDIWSYLSARYDANGDGRIVRAEYGRTDEAFERLDRNGDDALTAADFERSSGPSTQQMRSMRARYVVARYFQTDGEGNTLDLEELEQATRSYDRDGDGAVSQQEFEAQAEARAVHGQELSDQILQRLEGYGMWTTLAAGVDADENGALSTDELRAFFQRQDDGDGAWNLAPRRRSNQARRGGGNRPPSGAQAGQPAPDFSLEPLHGGELVTLSSFRDKQPVALLFGSYT